jgi:GT2 family glycosyltransferase
LQSVVSLDYPQNKLEVLLVDGRSSDQTPDIASSWQRRDSRIRCFDNPRRIVAAGMNIGLREARYELILWISGHVILEPDHLKKCVFTLQNTGAAAVGGVIRTVGESLIGELNAAVLSSRFGVGNPPHRVGKKSGWVRAVTMALYRKDAILSIGGFDESLPRNQDNDLHARMNKAGFRSYQNVDIRPIYICRETLGGLLRQAWSNGYWNIRLARAGFSGLSLRHFIPALFVISLLLLLLATLIFEWGWVLLLTVLAAYMAAAVTAAIGTGLRRRLSWHILALPFWFLMLHISYGLASCASLLTGKSITIERNADQGS